MKFFLPGLAGACALFGAASATPITFDYAGAPVQVDGSSQDVNFNVVAPPGATIGDIVVTLDFTKCDDPINAAGDCVGAGFSFNREISFILTAPDGTSVTLIAIDDYSGQTPGAHVIVTLDDDAATAVGGSSLLSGTFSPSEALAAFLGGTVAGMWTLTVIDSVGLDPLQLNDFQITFEAITQVPLPSAILFFPAGLAGLAALRRRRKAKRA